MVAVVREPTREIDRPFGAVASVLGPGSWEDRQPRAQDPSPNRTAAEAAAVSTPRVGGWVLLAVLADQLQNARDVVLYRAVQVAASLEVGEQLF